MLQNQAEALRNANTGSQRIFLRTIPSGACALLPNADAGVDVVPNEAALEADNERRDASEKSKASAEDSLEVTNFVHL